MIETDGAVTDGSYRGAVVASLTPPGHCPYCLGDFDAGGGRTKDHIFVRALGGLRTIDCCRRCNSSFGSEVEGVLLRDAALLNFARGAKGLGSGRIRVTVGELDWPAVIDVRTMTIHRVSAVVPGEDCYHLQGSREEVEAAAAALVAAGRAGHEEVQRALAAAVPTSEPVEARFTVTLRLSEAARLTAKVALGAGTRAYGGQFYGSEFGDELRRWMWEPDAYGAGSGMEGEAIREFDKIVARYGIAPLLPPPPARTCVFIPRGDTTAVFVRVLDLLPTMAGIVVPGRMPVGAGLPVVITDAPHELVLREVASDVLAYARSIESASA